MINTGVVAADRARVFGLTGGIASGKSTVARMFAALGAPVIDADELAREVVEPGQPALAEIVTRFGSDMLDPTGRLDRKKLGALVFSDERARDDLNAIVHPRIAAAGQRAIARYEAAGHSLVLYEAALIVEKRLYTAMAGLVVVSVPEQTQRARLMARDDIDAEAADARLAAQAPLAEKLAVADHVIDNTGTTEQTRAQVERVWRALGDCE